MSLLDKVYDKYETLDFQYGQDNLNPVREVSLRKVDTLAKNIDSAYNLIKNRIVEIEKDTQPLIEKEINDSVVTGISPFEQLPTTDDGMKLSAAKAGSTGNYVFPNVTPKYTDAGLRVRIQMLMSQLASIIDTYPDSATDTEENNPVNDVQDNTFIDSVCDIQVNSDALLAVNFSRKSNTASLQWPAIENAHFYRVARRIEDKDFEYLPYTITDTGILSYSVQDTGLAFSTTYSYKVIPFDSEGKALSESNVETGTTINSPDSDILASFSSTTYKTTLTWTNFIVKNNLIPLPNEETYSFIQDGVTYHFVRYEVYRGTSSAKDTLYKNTNLFTSQSSVLSYTLQDTTQLVSYPDTHINYILCAVFANDEQLETIDSVSSFDDSYLRLWSSVSGCKASISSEEDEESENTYNYDETETSSDQEEAISEKTMTAMQSLLNSLDGADTSGDQLDVSTLATCAIQDLTVLNIVLSVLSVISVIINVINLIMFITSQLISIVQLAAAYWNNPTNIGKIIAMVAERLMAIVSSLIGRLISELLKNLNIDCASEMTASVLNQVQSILNASYNLSTTSVIEPLNMANSTWKSALELKKTLSEQLGSQNEKVKELMSEAKTSLLSALNSNPATSIVTSLISDDENVDWTKLTSLVKDVPELSSILKIIDSEKGTLEAVSQFKNLGTEWKNATTKWTWE